MVTINDNIDSFSKIYVSPYVKQCLDGFWVWRRLEFCFRLQSAPKASNDIAIILFASDSNFLLFV